MRSIGLYIDFPFCIARCAFCAFPVQGFRPGAAEQYLSALHKEIEIVSENKALKDCIIHSIYLGGGTPSHHPADHLIDLISLCQHRFQVEKDAEISLEAHPATLDKSNLSRLCEGGINRLSLGIQSFSDRHLKTLGRHHSAALADAAFLTARSVGFSNIGIDLIYGLPDQTKKDWYKTLQHAIDLSPEHLSTYALSIEEGTLLGKMRKAGQLRLPSEEETLEYHESSRNRLAVAGYIQYEISNFAKPGYKCKHNLLYWNQGEIIGCGLAAHSYINNERRENTEKLFEYRASLKSGELPVHQVKKVGSKEAQIDKIIFGLRKTEGIPIQFLKNDLSLQNATKQLEKDGLITREGAYIRLSTKGLRLADEVAIAFI